MSKELKKALAERCKDMGLTDKALDELAKLGGASLADDASAEDISKVVDSIAPFAKAMQAEITRKTQPKQKQSTEQSSSEGEGEGDKGNQVPDWFKEQMQSFESRLQKMTDENDALKAQQAKAKRATEIADKAKELGIPDYLMKRVSFADDADISKELADYKQELVNNSLLPKGAAESGTSEDAMKEAAKSWAASLPDA